MCAADITAQKAILTRLLEEELDEQEQISCLRQLALDHLDRTIIEHAVVLLRARMIAVSANDPALIDLCGTGGDKSGSFNISTTASLVVAGAGYRVAKHGNVSITSKSGSIDMLRALGVRLPDTPGTALTQLDQAGIMFLFAPYYHPAFKKFSDARKHLAAEGTRTIFNLLGPLLNPAGVKRAVIGVFDPRFVGPVAEVLHHTGTEKALVFHGDGMDELSLTGNNIVCEINAGKLTSHEWVPENFGLPRCTAADLAGGTAAENAATAKAILQGDLADARKNMVLLNAGAAIYAASNVPDMTLEKAIALARQSLESGQALKVLERLNA